MKSVCIALFLCLSVSLLAQQKHFVYIQTEHQVAFYIKLDKKIYSSSASGYCIIPRLTDGSYSLQIGFPKNEWPNQIVTILVEKKDLGFLLKPVSEKGWGLFNLQTMELSKASLNMEKPGKPIVKTEDDFSNELAKVVKDSSIGQQVIVKESIKPDPVIVKNNTGINRLLLVNTDLGVEILYTDNSGTVADTIRVFIPAESKQLGTVVSNEKTMVSKRDTIVSRPIEAPVKTVPAVVVKSPVTETPIVVQQSDALKTLPVNDCKDMATNDDFLKLRKNMAAETDDDDMIAVARKLFKIKCFSTEQIKNLSFLFLKDEGKYKFFDAAYKFVSDLQHFSGLSNQLSDEYYINRFKAMIK